jgi:superfamily II DNA/RNA helicase
VRVRSTISAQVATDVAARGLDVAGVSLVIHYDVAPTMKLFVHRAGRTARAGREGRSVSLVGPRDASRHESIEAALGAPFVDRKIDARVVAEAADRARLAKKLADAERHAARDRAGRDWARRAADAADLVLDDDAAVGEAGGPQQRDLDEMLEAGASRPQGRMAVVNADTLRMLADEKARGDAGPRPRDKKKRRKRK